MAGAKPDPRDEAGSVIAEYALLLALVVAVSAASLVGLGNIMGEQLHNLAGQVVAGAPPGNGGHFAMTIEATGTTEGAAGYNLCTEVPCTVTVPQSGTGWSAQQQLVTSGATGNVGYVLTNVMAPATGHVQLRPDGAIEVDPSALMAPEPEPMTVTATDSKGATAALDFYLVVVTYLPAMVLSPGDACTLSLQPPSDGAPTCHDAAGHADYSWLDGLYMYSEDGWLEITGSTPGPGQVLDSDAFAAGAQAGWSCAPGGQVGQSSCTELSTNVTGLGPFALAAA